MGFLKKFRTFLKHYELQWHFVYYNLHLFIIQFPVQCIEKHKLQFIKFIFPSNSHALKYKTLDHINVQHMMMYPMMELYSSGFLIMIILNPVL